MGEDIMNIFNSNEYNAPSTEVVHMNTSSGVLEEVEEKEITPWETLQNASELFGIEIKEPEDGCKKCHGRGYVSIDTDSKMPVGCECIFDESVLGSIDSIPDMPNPPAKLSRVERRKMQRKLDKERRREAKKRKRV